jgi:Tfp pilus assembly protein PilN
VIFSTAVVISLVLVSTSILNYKTSKLENTDLHREIAGLEEVNTIYDAHALAVQTYEAVQTIYALTVNPNEKLNEFITELEEKLPNSVIVETFNVTSTDVTLSIKGDSKETAAKLLLQLKSCASLSQVGTSAITETEDEYGVKTVQFCSHLPVRGKPCD